MIEYNGLSVLFGWSQLHIQPLTLVSEVSELLELPSLCLDLGAETFTSQLIEVEKEMEEAEEIESPPAVVPFSRLFAYTDCLDWFLMIIGSLVATTHDTALIVYLHYFTKVL